MVRQLEFKPAAAPATVLESEGTGREGRARGSTLVTPGMGDGVGYGGRGSHGCGGRELVGSSAQAAIGKNLA